MKIKNSIITCGALINASLLFVSCVKQTGKEVAIETTDFSNRSFVQVFDATLGSNRNYLYVDGAPLTGASLTYGNTFPSTPANFSIPAGLRNFLIRDTLAATTQPPMSFSESLQASSNYTIFTYDTLTTVKKKTVLNTIVVPDDTTCRLRFANFAYSPNALPAVDVFSKRLNTNIFTNVAITDVTNFIPYDSRRSDTLIIREAGSGVDLQNRTVTTSGTPPVTVTTFSPVQIIITLIRKRSYTVIFRGGFRTDLTTAATVRGLSLFANN
jgi:hypothetical protein